MIEYAYVRSCVIPEVTYFAMPLNLGPDGIQKNLGVPRLSDSECKLLEIAVPVLRKSIKKGEVSFTCIQKSAELLKQKESII